MISDFATGKHMRVIVTGTGELQQLWEAAGHNSHIPTFEGHGGYVTSVCLSADGRRALTGSEDKTLRLWDVATCQCLRAFEGHSQTVSSVSLSRDGRWALSGSHDCTLRLWDTQEGCCLRTFEGHTDKIRSVHLSADGRWAISGSEDKTIRLWELDWDYRAVEPIDWDEGARPHLESFLTLHTPYAAQLPTDRAPSEEEITLALTRCGCPSWTQGDFQCLLETLANAGYGWLRPEGVRHELEKMARAHE